jgi:hypothetical protein
MIVAFSGNPQAVSARTPLPQRPAVDVPRPVRLLISLLSPLGSAKRGLRAEHELTIEAVVDPRNHLTVLLSITIGPFSRFRPYFGYPMSSCDQLRLLMSKFI